MKCKHSRPRFELMSLCPFPTTITITPWALPLSPTLHSGRIWHKVNIFKQSLTGLNSEFSFSWTSCLTKAEEPSLSYYLPIAGGRIIGFIPLLSLGRVVKYADVVFWPSTQANMPFQSNAQEGSDTSQWPVIQRNRVGGIWLMKWDKTKKIPWYTHRLMHWKRVTCELHDSYDDDQTCHSNDWVGDWVGVELLYNSVKTRSQTVGVRIEISWRLDELEDKMW